MKKHWPTMEEGLPLKEAILFAESYPFPSKEKGFVLDHGMLRPVRPEDLDGRTPVAASGSNASPEQLLRKFGPADVIVVTMAEFDDLLIAYAALIAPYGSVPVSFVPCEGVRTRTAINWLDKRQLERMDESEGAPFHYARISTERPVHCDTARRLESVWYYESGDGFLLCDGEMIAPAERRIDHWSGPVMSQVDVLRYVSGLLDQERSFTDFMREILTDSAKRMRYQRDMPRKS